MSYATQLLDTYPGTVNVDAGVLAAAIDALSDCAQACIADVDADLSDQNLTEMVTCILKVPKTYATRRYSWMTPPTRSGRRTQK